MGTTLDDLAGVISALSRDLATALDPADVLDRTRAVLRAAISVGRIDLVLLDDADVLGEGGPVIEREAGAHVVELHGFDRPIGQLVVEPPEAGFTSMEVALLDAVGAQVGSAIERVRRFHEVMELERLKTDFIARVSHELRTPITIIAGFIDTVLTHDERLSAEQRRHMLERARNASSRLGRLIEELLVLSRIEAGVLSPEPAVVHVSEILDEVRSSAAEPEQVVVLGNGDVLRTDRVLLARALGLVVDNALKYGGTAEVAASRTGDHWTFEVRDRGPGFDEDIRAVAFEMFTRGDGTGAVPGLGVGLPIARTLVEVLDGRVEIAAPEPGEPGALVRVTLRA